MRKDKFIGQEKEMLFWEDGDNSIEVLDYMLQYNLRGIVVSKYLGFTGDVLNVHETIDFIDEVHIVDSNIKDISFILNFPNVKKMNIQNKDKTKIDFNCFSELEILFLTWRKGAINLFNKKELKKLKLEDFKEKELIIGEELQLEEFWLSNSSVDNLSSLEKLKKLKNLHLSNLRRLEESNWMKSLNCLEVLCVDSCKKMSKTILENISDLVDLKKIFLSKMADIPTLTPINGLNKIEEIGFIENTKIIDGNLEPILMLRNLKKISMQGYSHYSPSVLTIRNNLNNKKSPVYN
jgi:hypothetical protein